MKKIYAYRKAEQWQHAWAEVLDGRPVHPGELLNRVRSLLACDAPFATQSDTVLAMLGYLVRTKQLALPVSVVYVAANGEARVIPFCDDGTLLRLLPEEGSASIQDAAFWYRYTNEGEVLR